MRRLFYFIILIAASSRLYAEESTPTQPSLLPDSAINGAPFRPGSDRIKNLGGRLLLDAYVESTQAFQEDKYIEFVGVSTPTVSLRTNHANLWLNNSAKQLCARFDDSSSGCLSLAINTIPQFLVSPSTGLIGGVFASNLILSNQISPSTGIANGKLAAGIILGNQVSLSTGVVGTLPLANETQFLVSASTGIIGGTFASNLILANQVSLSTGVTGSLPDSRLSSNVALLSSTQTFTGADTYSSSVTLNYTLLANNSAGTSGQILSTNGAGSAPSWIAAGSQAYYQEVSTVTTTTASTTSSSFKPTALQAVITPASSSHKIKVSATFVLDVQSGNSSAFATLERNQSNILATNGGCQLYTQSGGELFSMCSIVYVDSPATTSQVAYTVYFASANGSTTVQFGTGSITCSMVLEEVN